MIKDLEHYKISDIFTIREAIKKMDTGGIGFCICVNANDKVIGAMSDGDFRRGILEGYRLNDSVIKIINTKFVYVRSDYTRDTVEDMFKNLMVKHIPVIDDGELKDIITEEEFFGIKETFQVQEKLNIPVVIMAGGEGTRLEPFTKILPKPLIPIGDKPMIEIIMDEYSKFGMKNFHICINYKGRMIRSYLEDSKDDYTYNYITEDKPLGTAGALKLLENKIDGPLFVSNCDILIRDNYSEIYNFHKNGDFSLTMVAAMQNHVIPYGVCEIENGGTLSKITEKPNYDFLINTGMYLLNSEVLKFIPEDSFFHITTLIEVLQKENHKIGVYPISEKSWVDVGQWSEYKRTMKQFSELAN